MKYLYALVLIFALSPTITYSKDIIKMRPVFYSDGAEKSYKYQLVDLLLRTTQDEYGPYEIHFAENTHSQKRDINQLRSGAINVFISMTSKEREAQMYPIRYPVFKGLYGYRVFLIKDGNQANFTSIQNLDDLKTLVGIQGTHWPDLEILKANGLNIENASQHNNLMLQFGRVDYFPRGLHEPWQELKDRPNMDLSVEQYLLLYYPAPGYIFVDKENTRLASRFEEGFKRIINNGEFDQFFNNHPQIVNVKKQANLTERTLIKLKNPLLSPLTPLEDERLWYRLDDNK